jgi:hypothetical protein
MDKIFFHGRSSKTPYKGSYIFITDNLEYAINYSDGKIIYAYKIPFNENLLFSILNKKHLKILEKYINKRNIKQIISDSGENNEIDWAALNYIENEIYETPENLLASLGFKGVKLKERSEIESILIFNQNEIELIEKINITTPEIIKKIQKYHKKNNLTELIKKSIKTYIIEQKEKLIKKTHRGNIYELPDGKIMKLTIDIIEYENAIKIINNPSKFFIKYYSAEPYGKHYKLIMEKLTELSDNEYDMVDIILMNLGRQDYMLNDNKRINFKQELKNHPEYYEDYGTLNEMFNILNTLKNIYAAAKERNITLYDLRASNLGKTKKGNIVHFDIGAG